MAIDPTKPLLRLVPERHRDRETGQPRQFPRPRPYSTPEQTRKFGPAFNRLAEVLRRDPNGLTLKSDPTALAPERLLVFEVRGPIASFANAIRRVRGLELIDEEELAADDDPNPAAYLLMPDVRALQELESLWRRWLEGRLQRGQTPWRDVFALLRDLRPWGPQDRVRKEDGDFLRQEVANLNDSEPVRIEVELVYRSNQEARQSQEDEIRAVVAAADGRVVSRARISDIAYHALLVELPARAVRALLNERSSSLSALDPVMHIRPQSTATRIDIEDQTELRRRPASEPVGEPILGLLDGVPIGAHPLLARHMRIDDQFSLESSTPVGDRVHGTAMASLIVHGDLNRREPSLPRQIHVVPVLGPSDRFASDRLIVDVVYTAIRAMRDGDAPTAPNVVIVNLSLGNAKRPFQGQLSAWARLLDRLAYRFGLLFLVSAGNHISDFPIASFETRTSYEDSPATHRSIETLRAIGGLMAERRLLAPAETVNGLTVGASNVDAVSAADRRTARVNVDPYRDLTFTNPSSALGPGFARSVKPDFLMPGAKEHLTVVRSHHIEVRPGRSGRYAGLRAAAPPIDGRHDSTGYTSGTSAATALASRTAHRIYDALEGEYGRNFTSLPPTSRAVVLKALLAHPAKWTTDAAALIRSTIGPPSGSQHVRQKDNIRRFLGYGFVDADEAVACAADRATFWATGNLHADTRVSLAVPIPTAYGGQARPHALAATLAWFTPVVAGRRTYRAVRLKLLEPTELDPLRLGPNSNQPDSNQSNRGTLFSRSWIGDRAPTVNQNMTIQIDVQREPDQGMTVDEAVPFGIAITLAMPGVNQIYDEVRARLAVRPRTRI